jgi:membrane protease YdiL (CAAX protease family)
MVSPIPLFIMMVIIGPIAEEILCRYLLVGKLRAYGEKTAVIMGGLFFGLFHGNLEQFFYSALVGMLWSYIYLKTGKLKYTIFLHMTMNLLCGFLPMVLTRFAVDYDGLMDGLYKLTEVVDPAEQLKILGEFFEKYSADYAIVIGYNMITLGLSFAGAFILLSQRRRIKFAKGERQIDHALIGETIFLSPGVMLFIVGSLLYMGLELYLALSAA